MHKNTKRLLIATGIFPPSIGGPATYAKMLEDELPRYGVTPTVLAFDRLLHLPKGIRHLVYFWRLYKLAKDTDLIYAQDPISVGVPALFVSYLLAKPLYLRVPGDYAWEQACQRYGVTDLLDIFLERRDYPSAVMRLRRLEKKVANSASRIIVPSNYLKNVVLKWGIREDKISVVANSFDGSVPSESKMVLRSELGLKTKTIISAGRMVPWKGFATLISGLSGLLKEQNISFLIVGTGPDEIALKSLVKNLELENNVTFLGSLDRIDLMRYLKASDTFVLNTAYEGFSHQILEAMMCGTPVVTTSVGGNGELIDDGVHGFLLPLNDMEMFKERIKTLLNDPNLAEAMGLKAHERATLFTKNTALERLVSLLP